MRLQRLGAGAQLGHRHGVERARVGGQDVVHVLLALVDVEQARGHRALGGVGADGHEGRIGVARIVLGAELVQEQARAVVQLDVGRRALGVVDGDLLLGLDVVEPVLGRHVVGAHRVVALGRGGVVVEGDARADHVEEGEAVVADGGLEQRDQLRLVAGERAGDEAGAELDRQLAQVDGVERVGLALLGRRGLVVGGRELALGEAVAAVVHDDVGHVHAPAHGMAELAEPDRGGVAVAGDADVDEVAVGDGGAGGDRRHAPVHGVEAVAARQEVGRRLRRAADARHLGDAVRGQVHLEAGLDQRGRDRVVPAARAQGRHAAFVVAPRQAERVARQRGMMRGGFRDVAHRSSYSAATWAGFSSFSTAPRTKAAVIGMPS